MHLDAHKSKKRIERVSVRLRHAGPIQALNWLGISIQNSTVSLGGLCEQLSSLWCVARFYELRRESCGLEEARRCAASCDITYFSEPSTSQLVLLRFTTLRL